MRTTRPDALPPEAAGAGDPVADDPREPGEEPGGRRDAQPVERPEGVDEGLLEDVFHFQSLVPDEPAHDALQLRAKRIDETRERLRIPAPCEEQQRLSGEPEAGLHAIGVMGGASAVDATRPLLRGRNSPGA